MTLFRLFHFCATWREFPAEKTKFENVCLGHQILQLERVGAGCVGTRLPTVGTRTGKGGGALP